MASPFQRRLAIKLTNRSPSFTKPHRIKIIPPLCLYSSSSSHSKGKASESKITGLAAAFGCLGMVGLVGVAFGMSARSQQQVVRQEQRMFSTNVDQKTSSGSDQSSLAALNEEPENPSDSSSQQSAFNPETGEINWDCPCLGGMAHGVCGEQFKAAFGCFVYSDAEPKGVECIDKFKLMQDCFKEHPDVYGEELIGQDEDQQPDEDQGQTESEHTSRTLTAPTPPSGPEESLSLTVPSPEPDITLPASRLPKADQSVPTNQPAATTLTSDQRSEN